MRKITAVLLVLVMSVGLLPAISVYSDSYSDVSWHWAETYITELSSRDILKGYDGKFFPDDSINRGDVAVILDRIYKFEGYTYSNINRASQSKDFSKSSEWAKFGISDIMKIGLMQGDENGNFNPQNNLTRAEIAAIAYNAIYMAGDEQSPVPSAESQTPTSVSTSIAENLTGYVDPAEYEESRGYHDYYRDNIAGDYYSNKQGFRIEVDDYNKMLTKRKAIYSAVITSGMSEFEKI